MKKLIVVLLGAIYLMGCAGLGLNKSATLMPDEVWLTGDTNLDNEDSSEVGFGIKWKLK